MGGWDYAEVPALKCPICGAWSTVLDTREGLSETVRRRRKCANHHRFPTLEMHATMRNVGAMQRALQTIKARRKLWARDQKIIKDPRTAAEIAADYGLTKRTIHTIRRRRKQ